MDHRMTRSSHSCMPYGEAHTQRAPETGKNPLGTPEFVKLSFLVVLANLMGSTSWKSRGEQGS